MLHEVAGRLREQHLPAVISAHDACRLMHAQSHVALSRTLRLAGVQAHAHPHRYSFRPGMGEEGPLASDRCRDGIGGARKGHEERIPLRVNLIAIELEERGTQEGPTSFQEAGVALTHLLKQARRALDIGAEQCHGPCGELTHGGWSWSRCDSVFWGKHRGETRGGCLLRGVCQGGGEVLHTGKTQLWL